MRFIYYHRGTRKGTYLIKDYNMLKELLVDLVIIEVLSRREGKDHAFLSKWETMKSENFLLTSSILRVSNEDES